MEEEKLLSYTFCPDPLLSYSLLTPPTEPLPASSVIHTPPHPSPIHPPPAPEPRIPPRTRRKPILRSRVAEDQHAERFRKSTAAYTDILESAPPSFTQILRHLIDRPSSPLLLHCTAGKDRTGVFCALLLSLCGVDDETVAYEYSLTEAGLAHWREEVVAGLLAAHKLPVDKSAALNMLSARAESMMATLEMVRERFWGGGGVYA